MGTHLDCSSSLIKNVIKNTFNGLDPEYCFSKELNAILFKSACMDNRTPTNSSHTDGPFLLTLVGPQSFRLQTHEDLKLMTHCGTIPGAGALNFGLCTMCHQKDPTFFRSLSPKDPHFYQLSPSDPLFSTNSLSPKDPDTSLTLKDPHFCI